MAMDKERLLAYFQTSYLPREEVLFKLPFSISIESFWPELLNRRKAKAVILPLRNGDGVPYWYTLTDKMISSSEKLCERVMEQTEAVDPLKAPMTSAMTEEMFFTSFIEGAQIQFDEAMDFLQSGAEPEDIHEQMVWNNREAWSAMTRALYRPLDEAYISGLARLLTAEMDGQADSYRQLDTHPIAVMADMPYTVPPAFILPERMQEFYTFLRMRDVHPLLKASAAQAFLLVTRPFPEGNERLSRMVSSAVLLRSGYDFFRDISISSVIARDGYRYYKSMKDILRSDNGCDLTYFMEYYLDLLVRAVEDKADRDRHLEQEKEGQMIADQEALIASERDMAQTPLSHSASENDLEGNDYSLVERSTGDSNIPFPDRIKAFIAASRIPNEAAKKTDFLLQFYSQGKTEFTVDDVRKATGTSGRASTRLCYYLISKGLITRSTEHKTSVYCLALGDSETESVFEEKGWHTVSISADEPGEDATPTPFLDDTTGLKQYLIEMGKATATPRDQRISAFLLNCLQNNRLTFFYSDWDAVYPFGKNVIRADLLHAVNLGLIRRDIERGQSSHGFEYVICTSFSRENKTAVVTQGMTPLQITYVNKLYSHFGHEQFTMKGVSESLGISMANLSFHLRNLADRGILAYEKRANTYIYTVAVTPESHPECFAVIPEKEKQQKEVATLPASSSVISYAAMPSYAAAAVAV